MREGGVCCGPHGRRSLAFRFRLRGEIRVLLALDSETFLIRPALQAPPLVCVSWAHRRDALPNGYPLCQEPDVDYVVPQSIADRAAWAGLRRHDTALPLIESALDDADTTLVLANSPFDMAVFAAKWPHLIPKIFAAYDDGRIADVLIRQKLIDIAAGCYRGYFNEHGVWVSWGKSPYSLDAISQRLLGVTLDKADDGWRLRYSELHDVPLGRWPDRARDYALTDAVSTLFAYEVQEAYRERGWLEDEGRQAAASWALQLLSVYGVRTDPDRVARLSRQTKKRADELLSLLVDQGLVRVEVGKRNGKVKVTRSTKVAKERMVAKLAEKGIEPKLTESGEVALDEDACEMTGDRVLRCYAEYASILTVLSKDLPVLEAGTVYPIQPRYEVLLETGRTSAGGDTKGERAYGYNVQNIRRASAPRCPSCETKNDAAARKCKACERLLEPVLGIRECFVPRRGYVYADADYDGLELRTFAQCCILAVGFSRMAERLNAGMDVHLDVAAQLLNTNYDFALEASKGLHGDEWKKRVKDSRQIAKGLNFGLPGGLSAAGRDGTGGFRGYLIASGGPALSYEKCEELKRQWFAAWPEAPEYFRWVRDQLDPVHKEANVVQFFSGRHRGRIPFTVAANGFFQGLGADAAKAALFAVSKACYVDRTSPLYGSRPVMFIHDQIIVEVPEPVAHEAATELGRVMCAAGSVFLPDVPLTTTPCLSRVFSKDAVAIYDERKRLVPWEPKI